MTDFYLSCFSSPPVHTRRFFYVHFFAIPITDEWGTTYQLTTAGYTALVVLMLALLLLAALSAIVKQPKFSARQLAFSAMAIAAAFVTSEIKLFHLPFGGSITLFSMLFLVLIGYWYGLRAGLMTAIAYGFLQLVSDPYIISIPRCSLITSSHSVRSAYPACFPNRKTVW